MSEQWIIRVGGREYGPAALEILREWKGEGRVLPQNQARRVDVDVWVTAAEIPELFETLSAPPIQRMAPIPHRSFAKICIEAVQIYRKGFVQFFCLTLLVVLPSLCAQLTTAGLDASSTVDVDLRKLLAGGFALCMLLLFLAFWPIYISGIQILSAELAAGRRLGFFGLLNEAVKFWPRTALLCVFVYGAYFFWTVLPLGIILVLALGGPSIISLLIALVVLAFQVWIIGKLFVNFMFWQQFAVLENSDPANALRQSKELARCGRDLPWYRRPKWRGVFLASLWFAFVVLTNLTPAWPLIRHYFNEVTTSQDPQALLQEFAAQAKASGFDVTGFALGLLQAILRPLLGISFVLLYLDTKAGFRDAPDAD